MHSHFPIYWDLVISGNWSERENHATSPLSRNRFICSLNLTRDRAVSRKILVVWYHLFCFYSSDPMKLLSLSNIIEWQMSQKRGVTDVLVPALQNILVISARGFHKYSIEPGNTFYIPPSPKSESSGFIFQSNFRRLIQRPPRRFLVFRPLDWYHLKNEISPGRPPINLHPEGANNLWWVLAHSYFHIFYFPTEFAE